METSGWLQLALYVVALAVITKPMGLYLVQVLDANGRTWLDPVLKPLERLTYRLMGVRADQEQDWRQYTLAMLLFSLVSCLFTYAILRLQHHLPLNPQGFGALVARPGVQHRRQLHHQHQLAELRRRIHHVLSLADGRAGHPQLRLGGHRHRHRRGARARHRPAFGQDARQLLGGPRAHHLLPAAAHLPGVRRLPGVAGHDPEFQALHQGEAAGADENLRRQDGRQTASTGPRHRMASR